MTAASQPLFRPLADASGEDRLVALQNADGSWEGEVVWCPVITAQVAIVRAVVGRPASPERRSLMLRHFEASRRPDGGWGLHPQSRSYLFVTTLVYVAARLLGVGADDPMLVEARAFLSSEPAGVLALPQWGRFWLSLIGLYDTRELNVCPPELFLLPRRSALSPLRFYCHTRYIYLAMSYLIGRGFRADLGSLTEDLRRELPGADRAGPGAHAVPVAASDVHEKPGPLLNALYAAARRTGPAWRASPGAAGLRRRALARCLARIRYEQAATSFQGLSPVSGLLNTLALFAHDPSDADVTASLEGVEHWRWEDERDGTRYAGARSTTWDTGFALQALVAAGPASALHRAEAIRLGYRKLAAMQMVSELPGGAAQDRDPILGGWCVGDRVHGWPVSDCAAEAVIALVDCEAVPGLIADRDRLPRARLAQAAAFILSRQNADGGFGSYERRRGHAFLERLNPSEMFGRCMTELSYVECTASSVRALRRILSADAPVERAPIERAIRRGAALLLSRQRRDGSWPGFWGINFVYGTLFAVAGLRDAGLAPDHPALRRARSWIEGRQKPDGGWGEHHEGCVTGTYVENPDSLVITTAWATLALLYCDHSPSEAARRGGAWLAARQDGNGDWPRDGVNGVFFGTAMLDYRLYNTYFPVMAMAKLTRKLHDPV